MIFLHFCIDPVETHYILTIILQVVLVSNVLMPMMAAAEVQGITMTRTFFIMQFVRTWLKVVVPIKEIVKLRKSMDILLIRGV